MDNFNSEVYKIVNEFNENKEEDKKFKENKVIPFKFSYINQYVLYTRSVQTTPDWVGPLSQLSNEIIGTSNTSNSFVLFAQVNDKTFAVAGGQGYTVLSGHIHYDFGIQLLERLVEPNNPAVSRKTDRYITGNRIGSIHQYHQFVSLDSEAKLDNYIKSIAANLNKKIIEDTLGISIDSGKKSYMFEVKDSIKLGKSLRLDQLDSLLYKISILLDTKPLHTINFFRKLSDRDPVIKNLDISIAESLCDFIQKGLDINLQIIPYFTIGDKYKISIHNSKCTIEYSTKEEIKKFIKDNAPKELTNENVIDYLKKIELVVFSEGEKIDRNPLFVHLEHQILHKNRTYWLLDGNWHYVEGAFGQRLNDQFSKRIGPYHNENFTLSIIKQWKKGVSEGDYNFSHNDKENCFVLDKILVKNIEICDLLFFEGEKIYFIHVKDGVDGDMRVLEYQVLSSMKFLNNAINNETTIMREYYGSIRNKLDTQGESTIKTSAKKFINHFNQEDDFINFLIKPNVKINFVFAYRPKSQNLNSPKTISSTAAKISMIRLTEIIKSYDFGLKFLEIEKPS